MDNRLNQLQNLLKESPNEPFLLFAIAKEYEGKGDKENALAYYLSLFKTDPNYVGLYYHLGKLYEQLSNFPKALEAYATGMDIAKKAGDQHALNELAGARMEIDEDF